MAPSSEACRTVRPLELSHDMVVELLLEGPRLLGLGAVTCRGVPLRSGDLPLYPCFATPEGICYREFRNPSISQLEDQTILQVEAVGRWQTQTERLNSHWGIVRTAKDYLHPGEEFCDVLEWVFQPAVLALEEAEFVGMRYHYRFRGAEGRRIRRLEEMATWELGGSADDNTLIQRCYYTSEKHEVDLRREISYHSGGEKKGAAVGDWAFQYSLRWGGSIAPYDFLANAQGTLVRGYERPAFIRSWLCKEAGDNHLATFDEHFGALSESFETVGTFVGFAPARPGRSRTEMRNLWTAVHQHYTDEARAYAGTVANPIEPIISIDWIEPRNYHALWDMADRYLARMAALACRVVYIGPVWDSEYTRSGSRSACAVHEWQVPPEYGGMEGLQYFVRKAHEHGMLCILWCGGLFVGEGGNDFVKAHRDWVARYPNGRAFGSGYDAMVSFNLRNPEAYAYVRDRCKQILEESGADGYFWDSHVDAWFEPIDAVDGTFQPQFEEAMRLTAELQRMSKYLCVEAQSPFVQMMVGSPTGLAMLEGCEYANYDRHLGSHDWLDRPDAALIYYRYFAYGGGIRFAWTVLDRIEADPELAAAVRQTNLDIVAARPYMGKRRLLEGDPGVEWTSADGHAQVFFSFGESRYQPARRPVRVQSLTTGENVETDPEGGFQAQVRQTYLIHLQSE